MILFGSRCGGHDFHVDLPGFGRFWIGPVPESDLDVFLLPGQRRPSVPGLVVDAWTGGTPGVTGIDTAPYSVDGRVVWPSDLSYLQRVAKRRIRRAYGIHAVLSLAGREIDFFRPDGSWFTRQRFTHHVYR